MFWRIFSRKKRSLSDFDEEIRSHLALERDELAERTGPNMDHEAAAVREFGNIASIKESFYEHSRWIWWDQFWRDLRGALRLVWRRPAFSAIVIATLAVGIGATLAIFSVINAVLLRPLPYKDPSRLAMLWSADPAHGVQEGRVSLPNFADWKSASHTFQDLTIFNGQTFLLSGNDSIPERMRSARVSANFFPLLGVQPALGRVFLRDEEKGGERVVVLSDKLWRRRFNAAINVLGSDLIMDGRKYRIIGVMPAAFQYPFPDTQVWEPITAHPYWSTRDRVNPRTASNWFALGRVRDGASWTEVQAEMSLIAGQLAQAHPENRNQPEIRVVPLDEQTSGGMRLPLAVLFCSVVLMLLIACLNVANLLLASGSAREREFSVRRALGASQSKIAAQLLVESLVLSLIGGVAGLALAAVALRALIVFGPHDIPRLAEAHIDTASLIFTLGLSLFAALFSGLWPAMRKSVTILRSRTWTTVSDTHIRSLLVIGEFAIALVLLAGAGLMVRSFVRLQNVDLGFRPDHLLMMRIDLHVGRTNAQQVAYFKQAIDRVGALPGVRSAAAISSFLYTDPEDEVTIEGRPRQQPGPCDDLVSGPFFRTADIPLKRGRYLTEQDRQDSLPVAVINETMARTYWPDADSIGKRFRFSARPSSPWITVIGVTGDMRRQGVERRPTPQVFRPHAQDSEDMMEVIVRTAVDPEPMESIVRREIQSIDRSVAKFDVTTVDQQIGVQVAERRFQTSLMSLFSMIALGLSAIGIYGLMHYFVVQRTHEIGVRMALGADRGNVLALVVRQGLGLAGAGILIGTILALGFTTLLARLLYEVKPTDPLTLSIAPLILLSVATLACWLPARRAARIDPMAALRQD